MLGWERFFFNVFVLHDFICLGVEFLDDFIEPFGKIHAACWAFDEFGFAV